MGPITIALCLLDSLQIMLMISLTRDNILQRFVWLAKCVLKMVGPPSLRETVDSPKREKVVHSLLPAHGMSSSMFFYHSFGIEPRENIRLRDHLGRIKGRC